MTPPLDEEAENKESRLLETEARAILERQGCPPCYPPCLEVPLRNVPDKYQAIVSYWQSLPGTGDVVLRAQLFDWQAFHAFQSRNRRKNQHERLDRYVEEVRELRRKYNIRGKVVLRSNTTQQSPLENWIEFQYYHLRIHEQLETERDDMRGKRDKARKEAENMASVDLTWAVFCYERRSETSERKLQTHKILLHWIEQKRALMDAGHSATVQDHGDGLDAVSKCVKAICTRSRQKRRPKTPTNSRISKARPGKRNVQRQGRAALESKPQVRTRYGRISKPPVRWMPG